MKLEFITEKKVSKLDNESLYKFIIDRILDNRILIIEKYLNPVQKMELIAKGLEEAQTESCNGINLVQVTISNYSSGFIRNKKQELIFNLIAPGNSEIKQEEDGYFSIQTSNGEKFSVFN